MHVAESLFVHSIQNREIINTISTHFQREVRISNTLYRGSLSNESVNKRKKSSECERIHFRVTRQAYEILAVFAYALGCSYARAGAVLLEECIHDADFISKYVEKYLEENLSSSRMKELREFMRYVNREEDGEVHSWAALLSYITDEVKKPFKEAKEVVEDFIIHHWNKD